MRYYPDGKPRAEGTYKRGKKDGIWLAFHENGQKKMEGKFVDGKAEGTVKEWDEEGKPVTKRRDFTDLFAKETTIGQ